MKFIPVGFWCRKCETLIPPENKFCECLVPADKPEAVEAFKKHEWLPVFAHFPKYGAISPFD